MGAAFLRMRCLSGGCLCRKLCEKTVWVLCLQDTTVQDVLLRDVSKRDFCVFDGCAECQ